MYIYLPYLLGDLRDLLLLRGEDFLLRGEDFLLRGEDFLLRGEDFLLRGEDFLLKEVFTPLDLLLFGEFFILRQNNPCLPWPTAQPACMQPDESGPYLEHRLGDL